MDKTNLIDKITPLYNLYKENKDKIAPTKALFLMWEIGDILKTYIDEHKVKPHTLYREIYGKSEGQRNIVQKSYITREFQSRCFRIRNIFQDKEKISRLLPCLNNSTAFREAMPFFDNPRYGLKSGEKRELLELLNSHIKPSTLMRRIRILQADKINKKNRFFLEYCGVFCVTY